MGGRHGGCGLLRTRGGRVCGALLLSVVMLLGLAATAHATVITNWTGVQPTGVITATKALIVNGTGTYDGFPMSAATAKLYVDGALIPSGTYTATARDVRSVYFYYNPQPRLADGPHTFRVEMSDTAGRVSAYQWGATVAVPPTAAWLAPGAYATLYTGRPTIVLNLADNTPDTAFAVAGEIRTGSGTGPVVGTFGGTGLAAGANSFVPASELAPGTYYLTATVTDAVGAVRSLQGAAARSFTLVSAPAMSVTPSDCMAAGCHVRSGHPASGMACNSCHVVDYHGYGDSCDSCHDAHTAPVTVTDVFGPCTACHSPSFPSVPRHTAASVDAAHASSCNGCHNESLLARHAVAPYGSVYPYQCALCHANSNARVTAAVATGDTSCSACHDVGEGHGFDPAMHTADLDGEQLAGTWPYVETNAAVSGTLMNVPYQYSGIVCLDCHSVMIAGDGGEHSKSTASTAEAGCLACHPSPRNTFTVWDKTCYACHEVADVHSPEGLSAVHSLVGDPAETGSCGFINPLNGRRPCHYLDVVQEHNRKINPDVYTANKVLSVTCEQCHTNPATVAALADGWDGTCTDCHDGTALPNHTVSGSARYDEVYALHDNPGGFYDAGYNSSTGVPVQGYNAIDAHGPVRVNPSGGANKTIGCGAPTCHTSAYIGGGWPFGAGPACAECHGPNLVTVGAYQGDYAWYSDTWVDGQALDTRLTMTLDPITLPADSALDFMTFYDIEQGWDYGYVQVSTDGGSSWTNLVGNITTTSNPYGLNLGNGVTGATGGQWIPAHFDLSGYGGQTVMIRFSYQADFYVYGNGWMLDVISVGPEGAPVFYDDVETLASEWEVETEISYWEWDDDLEQDVLVTVPTTQTGWKRHTQ